MYIRSQDKKMLVNFQSLRIEKSGTQTVFAIADTLTCILGYYSSEERAIEVLDEIQGALRMCGTIYAMPEDSEAQRKAMKIGDRL